VAGRIAAHKALELLQPVMDALTAQPSEIERLRAGCEEWRRQAESVAANAGKAEAEIERLKAELAEARAIVANVNNSVFGSQGYFTKPYCVEAVDNLKAECNRLRYQRIEIARTAFMAGVTARQLHGVNGPWSFPPFDPTTCAPALYRDAFEQWWQNAVDALPPAPDAKDAIPPAPDASPVKEE
jgi:hypothetical protein